MITDFKKLEDCPYSIFYRIRPFQEDFQGKKSYITTIKILDNVKVTNVMYLFAASNLALESLFAGSPEVNKENTIVHTIYELEKGIRFIPDVRMINYARDFTKQIETGKSSVALGGIILITGSRFVNKYKKTFMNLVRRFAPETYFDIVNTHTEAFESLDHMRTTFPAAN